MEAIPQTPGRSRSRIQVKSCWKARLRPRTPNRAREGLRPNGVVAIYLKETRMSEIASKKIFENDKIAVWELVLEPGKSTGIHTHLQGNPGGNQVKHKAPRFYSLPKEQ